MSTPKLKKNPDLAKLAALLLDVVEVLDLSEVRIAELMQYWSADFMARERAVFNLVASTISNLSTQAKNMAKSIAS